MVQPDANTASSSHCLVLRTKDSIGTDRPPNDKSVLLSPTGSVSLECGRGGEQQRPMAILASESEPGAIMARAMADCRLSL
jgi:hypothetical protein